MIERKGNILKNLPDDGSVVICHQVNCRGVMGAGLAKQVREAYPDLYEEYRKLCKSHAGHTDKLLGGVMFWAIENGNLIANLFGQDGYAFGGVHTDYNALSNAFALLAQKYPDKTIRIPCRIGCGLGGGDWEKVRQIICETLIDKGVYVELWSL